MNKCSSATLLFASIVLGASSIANGGQLTIKAVDAAEKPMAARKFRYSLLVRVSENTSPRSIRSNVSITADNAGQVIIPIDDALVGSQEREAIVQIKAANTETVVVEFLLRKETHTAVLVFRSRVTTVRVESGSELIAVFSGASSGQFQLRGKAGSAFYTDPLTGRKLLQGLQYERSGDNFTYYSEGEATNRKWAFGSKEKYVCVIRNGCQQFVSRGYAVWYRDASASRKWKIYAYMHRTFPNAVNDIPPLQPVDEND